MEKLLIIKPSYNLVNKDNLSSEEMWKSFFPAVEKENRMIVQYLLEKYTDVKNPLLFDSSYSFQNTHKGIGVMEDKKRWGGKILKTFYNLDTFEKYMTGVYEIVQWGYEWNLKRILEEI